LDLRAQPKAHYKEGGGAGVEGQEIEEEPNRRSLTQGERLL